jgi:MoaE-MoaD fusion protein
MITIKFFASLKDNAGTGEMSIAFPGGSVADLLTRITQEHPALAGVLSSNALMISINQEFVRANAIVRDGDEVALMPPFSGGGPQAGQVRIQEKPFSIEREISMLKKSSTAIGAVVTFVGTTRDISKGKNVAKLDFEHYPGMAERKLAEIRDRAIRDYGVVDVTIVHRVGTMPIGEEIVLIVVVSGHRDEAFKACRFCIDELKRITPIWKKETTPEGEVWVEEHP